MKLVDNWIIDLKRAWSIRMAAAFGIIASVLMANPSLVLGLIAFMPTGFWRYVASAGVGFVVFVIPTIAKLTAQPKLAEAKEKADG
jgi:hypothetical protein